MRKMRFAFGCAGVVLLVSGAVLALRDMDAMRRLSQIKVLLLSGTVLAVLAIAARSVQSGRMLRWFGNDAADTEEAGAKYRGLLEAAPDAMVVVPSAMSRLTRWESTHNTLKESLACSSGCTSVKSLRAPA